MKSASKRNSAIAAVVLALVASTFSFSAGAQPRAAARFAGIWNGKHNGKAFVILKLKDTEPPSGSISTGVIRADDAGRITEVEKEASEEHPLGNFAEKGGVLSFSSREDDGEVMRYEMKLLQPTEAELKILQAPVQPFAISKQ